MDRFHLYLKPMKIDAFTFFKFPLFLICLALILAGCVTNKKFVLLQNNDVKAKGLPTDSIVREYVAKKFEYKIQKNDLISVRFESVTPKEFDFLSMSKGNVTNVQNLGGGAALFLVGLAKNYLESPNVKVRLLNYRVTMLGELNREGTVFINNNRVSVLEAIGLAGGMTDLADRSKLKLIRQAGDSVDVVYINLLAENFINSPYYYVYQNDLIVVPSLKQRPYRKYFGQNLALIISTLTLLLLVINLNLKP